MHNKGATPDDLDFDIRYRYCHMSPFYVTFPNNLTVVYCLLINY